MVDAHERYPYQFTGQRVSTVRRDLSCGDYAVTCGGQVVAAVERKSLPDLVSSLTSGRLRYALGELATLPRAAVVVEDRYSQIFTLDPPLPAVGRIGAGEVTAGSERPEPSTSELRAWARANGLPVSDRGRLRPGIHQAWQDAHRD